MQLLYTAEQINICNKKTNFKRIFLQYQEFLEEILKKSEENMIINK